jgi:hypothetical protein
VQPEENPQFKQNMQPKSHVYRSARQEAEDFKRKTRLIIQLAIILVLFVFATTAYNIYKDHQFRVVSTNPSTRNVATATPFFKVIFNRQLSKDNLSVSSNPAIISSYSINGDELDMNLNTPTDSNTTYNITINSISAADGKTLTDKNFKFQPKQVNSQDLPQDQQQALLKNQTQYLQQRQDPIIAYLPYGTLDFNLNYHFINQSTNSKIILDAQLQLAPGLSGAQATATTNQYKQEVTDYIKSKGLNPASYTIEYQVVQESLTGV